ncbi:hypothetical protein EVAR_22754_1 [Eumeta japonica]|uniref:Uncharacterized protein n=1 Tax=Eumeta variegata TaxID=151549 RepID=A0A4C1UTR0_EUMVA|nr:hypothetical protein EVAR_22754_1 [Eumeta japonica]
MIFALQFANYVEEAYKASPKADFSSSCFAPPGYWFPERAWWVARSPQSSLELPILLYGNLSSPQEGSDTSQGVGRCARGPRLYAPRAHVRAHEAATLLCKIMMDEIKKPLKDMKGGFDRAPSEMLRNGEVIVTSLLYQLINKC